MKIHDEDTGNMMVNQIIVGSSQASGLFSALQIKSYQTAGTQSCWDYGHALNVCADATAGTISSGFNASGHWLNLGETTITGGNVSALRAGIYEGGDCTFTSCATLAPLSLAVNVATDPGTGFCQIYCRNDGAQAIDGFIYAETAGAIAQVATAVAADDAAAKSMKIVVNGTTYYIPTYTAAELA